MLESESNSTQSELGKIQFIHRKFLPLALPDLDARCKHPFNTIRPTVFDALGTGQPRAVKLCMCIEQHMGNKKMKSIFRHDM